LKPTRAKNRDKIKVRRRGGGKGRVIKNQTEKGEKAIKTETKRQKRVKKLT
jgi:hypothetical protein